MKKKLCILFLVLGMLIGQLIVANNSIKADGVKVWLEATNGGEITCSIPDGQGSTKLVKVEAGKNFELTGPYGTTPGTTVELTATPATGNRFVGWYKKWNSTETELVSSSASFNYVLPTEAGETLTAAFSATADLHLWTYGHGKIMVNDVNYGNEHQGTWQVGSELSVKATADEGYRFGRWWIRRADGTTGIVETSEMTITAGDVVEGNVTFGLENAYVTVEAPVAGQSSETVPQVSLPSGAGYTIDTDSSYGGVWWAADTDQHSAAKYTGTFEAGQTYYIHVRLKDGADSFAATAGGSEFNTALQATGGTVLWNSNSANATQGGADYMAIDGLIAVVALPSASSHTVTFEMRGHYTPIPEVQTIENGGKATKPVKPLVDENASDYDTSGLHFRSWNETAPADLTNQTLWNGNFSFDTIINENKVLHAIYWAVLTLETRDATNNVDRQGGTITYSDIYQNSPQTISSVQTTIIEGTKETLTANPAEGYSFVGWSTSASDTGIFSSNNPYTFTNQGRRTIYALFEKNHEHDWDNPTYEWLDNNRKVKAERTCKLNPNHKQTETVDTTSQVVLDPTCVAKGKTKYTADFNNEAFAQQNKTVEDIPIDTNAHDYGAAGYEWSDDNKKVTAERICSRSADHVDSEVANTSSRIVLNPTCMAKGKTEYTAVFRNEAFEKKTIVVEDIPIDSNAHDWDEWEVISEPSRTTEGLERRRCKLNNEHFEERPIPVLSYRNTKGDGAIYTGGSGSSLEFIFKRSFKDPETFVHFKGIKVDDQGVPAEKYTAVSGSVIVTLKSSYLETLSIVEHRLTALFDDGNDVTVRFRIKEKEKEKERSSSDDKKSADRPHNVIPRTGISLISVDEGGVIIPTGYLLIPLAVLAFVLIRRERFNR